MANSFSLRRLKALIIKEFFQIVRDPSSILIGIFIPILLLFVYGYGVSLDINHIKIGLVMEDTSPTARSFAQSLVDSRYFIVRTVQDRRQLTDALTRGEIRGIVVVPADFSAKRLRPANIAPIQIITDASEPNTASFVQSYVQGAWQAWLKEESISDYLQGLSKVELRTRFWYNEELISRDFLIPGSLALIITLTGTLLTALVVAKEWERGTMESLMSTPVTISELLLGKLIPYFIFSFLSFGMSVFCAVVIYGVPLRGSLFLLGISASIFLLTALGLGLLISTIARNQFVAAQAAQITAFLPAFILSGFLFEIASMPWPIRMLTYILPARYFVSSLQTLFLAGDIWSLILYNMMPMIIIAIIFFYFSVRLNVKRLD